MFRSRPQKTQNPEKIRPQVVSDTFAWNSLTILRKIPKTDAFVLVAVTAVTVQCNLAVAVIAGAPLPAPRSSAHPTTVVRASSPDLERSRRAIQARP